MRGIEMPRVKAGELCLTPHATYHEKFSAKQVFSQKRWIYMTAKISYKEMVLKNKSLDLFGDEEEGHL
ncbi:hypothetical protein KY335_03215 [Candidatus Woesearchaeota archaeon]|nr:hypothetical protein [Candidatus Woesearchaeota archaeon]MBW3014226.1 hypothetical protein [Candidatus Woesearchaeota archaeon]